MMEKSRAMVRATRVDDVFDMLCPSQRTRDVLTISTLGLLILQILLDDPEEKNLDGAGGSYSMRSSPTVCDHGENFNDFVERLLHEGAVTECSGTDERCVHLETAFSSTSFLLWSCAITLPSGSAWPDVSGVQAMLSGSYAEHCVLWRRSSMATSSRLQVSLQTL